MVTSVCRQRRWPRLLGQFDGLFVCGRLLCFLITHFVVGLLCLFFDKLCIFKIAELAAARLVMHVHVVITS